MAQWTRDLWCAIQSAGLLPAGAMMHSEEPELEGNLLPRLCELWRRDGIDSTMADRRERAQGRSRRAFEWLEAEQGRGAALTFGVPGIPDEALRRWLGPRLFCWPDGIPRGRRIGIVSSRLGRALDEKRDWFGVLRTACLRLDPVRDILLTAAETTTFRFLNHCAARFGVRALQLEASDAVDLATWVKRLRTRQGTDSDSPSSRVLVSPPLVEAGHVAPSVADAPIRDRAVMALSDRVLALHLRRRGNLHRLTSARLADPSWPLGSVLVAMGEGLVSNSLATELQELGAVGWILLGDESHETGTGSDQDDPCHETGTGSDQDDRCLSHFHDLPVLESAAARIVPVPPSSDWPYLIHWTRRQRGPWPDQREADYLDELLFESKAADRSAFAALIHIMQQRRLFASSEGIRGGYRVVSFTAVPLAELPDRRIFQPHRARWDFEPYGICIRRDWLEARGAQTVRYGDDDLWQSLSESDRPFFQKQTTRLRRSRRRVDWSGEREWRHVNDVDLTGLSPEAGLVFVSTIQEAQQLAAISPWPIAVVSGR